MSTRVCNGLTEAGGILKYIYDPDRKRAENLLFTILELVGSTCYIIWEADVSPVGGIPVNIGGFHHFYAESRKNQILVINRAKFIHIKQHQVNSVMPRCQTDRFKCHIKLIIPIGFQFSQ